jgi:hypothetical protein
MKRTAFLFLTIMMLGRGAGAVECVNPTPLASIALTPPLGSFSGSTGGTITLGFGGSLPGDCETWVGFESPNAVAGGPITLPVHTSFRGAGPHTMSFLTHAVNQATTITISAYTKTGINASYPVGPTQTATMTVLPLPLNTFTINRNTLEQADTATGRIELGGGIGGLDGLARVNLIANPANTVTIPAFVDVGNQVTEFAPDRFTEYIKTFPISARDVAVPTDVTITASRAGLTRTDTIRVMPPCRVAVELRPVETRRPVGATINARVTNASATVCPATTLAMNMYIAKRVDGPATSLGTVSLDALAPNQEVTRSFFWQPVAHSGPRTFQLVFGQAYPGILRNDPSLVLSLTEEQVTFLAK